MCKFCKYESKNIVLVTSRSFLVVSEYPLGEISFLCIPKSHAKSITELSLGEKTDLWQLTFDVMEKMKRNFKPAGINVFLNEGISSGQLIEHLSVSIVARGLDDTRNFEPVGRLIPITEEEIQSVKKTLLKRGP